MIRYGLQRSIFINTRRCRNTRQHNLRNIFTASRRRSGRDSYSARSIQQEQKEEKELSDKIKQIQAYRISLQKYVRAKDDEEKKKKAAELENLKTDELASPEDIEKLAGFIDSEQTVDDIPRGTLFADPAGIVSLTDEVRNRVGNALIHVSAKEAKDQNWSILMEKLKENGGLKGLQTKDADVLLYKIPVSQRKKLLPVVHDMMQEADISMSGLTYGHVAAVHAEEGQVELIDALIEEMKKKEMQPNAHVYGNLIKALSKKSDLERCSEVFQQMKKENVSIPLEIYTTVMQTCIKLKEFKRADEIFELMKFLSIETQPDLKAYNSLLLSSAFQYNIERVLDLHREILQANIMENSAPEERQATYNILIYACARDERTHLKAWEYLLELHRQGLALNKMSLQSLMYLCGNTGEIMLARAMFKQLCQNPISYPTPIMLNSLMNAYGNFKDHGFSKVLSSPLGTKVQTNFVFDEMLTSDTTAVQMPPFLPLPFLADKIHVLAESRAIMTFYQTTRPEMINEKVALTYLKVAYNLKNLEEFKYRYEQVTCGPEKSQDETLKLSNKATRNHYIYDLAMQAAADTKDIEFGEKIWQERGIWRKSLDFQNLDKNQQDRSDFLFSRKMVDLFANRGEFYDAFDIIKSTSDKFNWKLYHVVQLHNKLMEIEDDRLLTELKRLVSKKKHFRNSHDKYPNFESQDALTVKAF